MGVNIAVANALNVEEAELELLDERTLFIEKLAYNDFPEMYSDDGSQLAVTILEYVIRDKVVGVIEKFAADKQVRLALAKMEKGYMIDSRGKVFKNVTVKGTTRKVYTESISTNNGVVMRVLKGRNFGGANFTTKGIDQLSFFKNYGSQAKLMGYLKITGGILNIFDIARFGLRVANGDKINLASIPALNPIALAVGVIATIAKVHFDEFNEMINEDLVKEFQNAKSKGLQAVKDLVWNRRAWNGVTKTHPKSELDEGEIAYIMEDISSTTVLEILEGKIKSYDELLDSKFTHNTKEVEDIAILIRKHGTNDGNIHVIETFFINTQE